MQRILLDNTQIVDKTSLLREVAVSCQFPDYFGMNWDALNDCLGDMTAGGLVPYSIVWKNSQQVDPQIVRTFVDICLGQNIQVILL